MMRCLAFLLACRALCESQTCHPDGVECHDMEDVNLLTHHQHFPHRRHEGGQKIHWWKHRRGDDSDDDVVTSESDAVACTYSKTYAYPSTVIQQDSGGVSQMDDRCSDASYVDNTSTATCILNSNSDGYDYDVWSADRACPYPAGATEYPITTTQQQCKDLYNNFTDLGDSVTWNGKTYWTGIGHGVLDGVRGNCYTASYNGNHAVIFQVDIRSWSLEITYRTLQQLYAGDPGGLCLIPDVQIINCLDIPGMPSSV
ncbi:unnamed protein product [Effrenium voratum]|uniref:Uncharacterized protein n=1 Tax=Effrenium voratum TaxID=2562239 RepID=A0AA36HKX4_9DINO|nr:unnamed protein product [Effrenium voratum]CAJ1454328.1 unnamed protein product [Effrenium voratum]